MQEHQAHLGKCNHRDDYVRSKSGALRVLANEDSDKIEDDEFDQGNQSFSLLLCNSLVHTVENETHNLALV